MTNLLHLLRLSKLITNKDNNMGYRSNARSHSPSKTAELPSIYSSITLHCGGRVNVFLRTLPIHGNMRSRLNSRKPARTDQSTLNLKNTFLCLVTSCWLVTMNPRSLPAPAAHLIGGCLTSEETGVSIYVPSGAIPAGVVQEIYFKVCKDNSMLRPLDTDKGKIR